MAIAVTGRSVLSVLHEKGGEFAIEMLAREMGAEVSSVERLVQSLLAARLVSQAGTAASIALTEAGRKWCASEFKKDTAPKPAPAAPVEKPVPAMLRPAPAAESGASRPTTLKLVRDDGRARLEVERARFTRPGNWLSGASSAQAKPRPAEAPPAPVRAAPVPAAIPAPAPVQAGAVVPVIASAPIVAAVVPPVEPEPVTPPPAIAAAPVVAEENSAAPAPTKKRASRRKASSPKYTTDDNGFITHINGEPIV